ncbi:outer membrane protein OmpA-like peptidoglycan-associated protein [Hoeflea marina]|uniref:Outer membrane protein OmpA-like peptidoglycan-associated protein n=1 Tax=Hoeflea marina TaxID=274592 RepID=A0A317PQR2_9HYPH|nr:OmpA family protein [Hoeflea marina]PWW03519.1 outer membrane protein OmpA-like peptidoglycan-associated protein [Hoeflea marina]
MRISSRLLASSAIALVTSASIAIALPVRPQVSSSESAGFARLIDRVQVSVPEAEAALAAAQAKLAEAQASGGDVGAAQAEVAQAQAELAAAQSAVSAPAAEAPPAPEAPAAEAPAPEAPAPQAEAPAPEAPAAEPQAEAPAPEVQPEAPAVEAPPAPEAPAAEAPAPEAPAPEAAPAEAPAVETAPEAQPEAPAAEAPAAPQPEAPAAEAVPEAEAPAADAPTPAAEAPAGEAAPADGAPAAEQTAPTPEAKPAADAPTPEAKPAAEAPAPGAEPAAEAAPAGGQTESTIAVTPEATLPVENGAPVLDSAKEEPAPAAADGSAPAPAQAAAPAEPAAPPPSTDAEAQAAISADVRQEKAPNPLAEESTGERRRDRPDREDRRDDREVVKRDGDRVIFQFNNRIIVRGGDDQRMRGARDEVYYEDLPRGRTREVIVRPNGVELVTITNRWGDVIQRSRVMPDGREIVLSYNPRYDREERVAYQDPGRDLPPLRLTIPIEDYILDATDADQSDYLDFLMEPPVERVERLYSVEEVRQSSRIRDKVRRVDMDTLTFDFGKATIAEDQIESLSNVASAMTEILDRNPAETFLLEGHTDAVGTDQANLLLSDKRAEAIAEALTGVFGIPPENLVAQGYGEQYLKVRTEKPEKLNRRVAIRRITPLVTPIAAN